MSVPSGWVQVGHGRRGRSSDQPYASALVLAEVDHDVVRRASGHPDEFVDVGGVALHVRRVRRNKHEVALFEVDPLPVPLPEEDVGAPLEHIASGFRLTVVVGLGRVAGWGLDLAQPDPAGVGVLLADTGQPERTLALRRHLMEVDSTDDLELWDLDTGLHARLASSLDWALLAGRY